MTSITRRPGDESLSLIDLFLKYHVPDGQKAMQMVYEVWEDGEITLTKGGDLFRQRSLHCIQPGGPNTLAVELLPMQNFNGSHGSVVVADHETATYLADQLRSFKA